MRGDGPIALDRLPVGEFEEDDKTVADLSGVPWSSASAPTVSEPAAVSREALYSPYLTEGARRHSERYGSLVDEAKRWRLAGYVLGALLAVMVVGYVVNYRTPRVTPYVVQVDEHGFAVAIEPAERHSASESRVIVAEVADFFKTMRTVIDDAQGQAALVDATYAHVAPGSDARRALDQWYRSHNPMADDSLQTVVDVTRVQPLQSSDTLTVEWTETTVEHGQQGSARFSAYVTVEIREVMTQEELIGNPLGVFVKQFSVERLD